MHHKHLPLTVVRLLFGPLFRLRPPFEGAGRQAAPFVAAQLGVMQKVPHEPDLRNGEAVNHHELFVEAGIERLKVRSSRRPGDSKSPKALVAIRFDADQLEAHSQEDVIDREQLHLEAFPELGGGEQGLHYISYALFIMHYRNSIIFYSYLIRHLLDFIYMHENCTGKNAFWL